MHQKCGGGHKKRAASPTLLLRNLWARGDRHRGDKYTHSGRKGINLLAVETRDCKRWERRAARSPKRKDWRRNFASGCLTSLSGALAQRRPRSRSLPARAEQTQVMPSPCCHLDCRRNERSLIELTKALFACRHHLRPLISPLACARNRSRLSNRYTRAFS